jgi:hypothetical protein
VISVKVVTTVPVSILASWKVQKQLIVAIVFVAGPQRSKDQHNHLLAFCDDASIAVTSTNLLLLMPKIMIDLLKRGIRGYLDFQLKRPQQ